MQYNFQRVDGTPITISLPPNATVDTLINELCKYNKHNPSHYDYRIVYKGRIYKNYNVITTDLANTCIFTVLIAPKQAKHMHAHSSDSKVEQYAHDDSDTEDDEHDDAHDDAHDSDYNDDALGNAGDDDHDHAGDDDDGEGDYGAGEIGGAIDPEQMLQQLNAGDVGHIVDGILQQLQQPQQPDQYQQIVQQALQQLLHVPIHMPQPAAAAAAPGAPVGPVATPEDLQNIQFLVDMGYNHNEVRELYYACDKDVDAVLTILQG